MKTDFDLEVLEIMEKYDLSFDEAVLRYERKQRQIALAQERKHAQDLKEAITKERQKEFIKAINDVQQEQLGRP